MIATLRSIATCITLCACAAHAQTTVGGIIDTDTTWTATGSPYRVTETIVVTGDATLTIHPSVEVLFDDGTGMIIGPESGTGTGELIIDGGSGLNETRLERGTGLVFGSQAVPAQTDPDTGAYIEGSLLARCTFVGTSPDLIDGEAFALRIGAAVPYLDDARVSSTVRGGGILVDLTDAPETSIRWSAVRVLGTEANGLTIRGGREHVLGALYSSETIRRSRSNRVLVFEPGPLAGPDAYDLAILGGVVSDEPLDFVLGLPGGDFAAGDRHYRIEGMTFRRCDGQAISLGRYATLELESCTFEDCFTPLDASSSRTLVQARDCTFQSGGTARGLTMVFEECRFIENTAPAVHATFASATRCTFVANSGSSLGGAIQGGAVDAYDSRFERNGATLGGAIYSATLASAGNTFTANTADKGGAIYLDEARRSLIGQPGRPDAFTGNAATQDGGAIFVDGELIEIVAIELERNTASRGGGIFVSPGGQRLLISREGGTGTFIGENLADIGDDIYVQAAASTGDILAPCIDWGTTDPTAIADRIYDGADDPTLATVNFEPIGPCDCRPDLDGDGVLTIFDFLAFQTAFDAGDLEIADLDGDGQLTIFDFLEFQTAFDAGCD